MNLILTQRRYTLAPSPSPDSGESPPIPSVSLGLGFPVRAEPAEFFADLARPLEEREEDLPRGT